MGKIICLMGKSSSGKDTIYKELQGVDRGKTSPECRAAGAALAARLRTIVPYTTRPIRAGERDGVEYFFRNEAGFQELMASGKVIEQREYHTFYGIWRYFTVDDGQFALDGEQDYIMIGTLESYRSLQAYFGEEKVLPVLIELDDGARLQRALNRERKQRQPKYEELCRRFLADSEDISEEKIREAGISRRFYNNNLERCLTEIREYIEENCR